ncbi:MAG: ferredoxin [Desulfobacterales bacterium]|nr:ferredoxin [Desulfobacterales bacterium]
MKVPVVELSDCILCEVCTEICPEVFQMNAAGYVEVIDLDAYPVAEVDEAIKNCPVDCIFWENK